MAMMIHQFDGKTDIDDTCLRVGLEDDGPLYLRPLGRFEG